MKEKRVKLRALVSRDKETGFWIAHCLEMDIVGQGSSQMAAVVNMAELCQLQLEFAQEDEIAEKNVFRPAPSEVIEAYEKARRQRLQATSLKRPMFNDSIEHIEAMELVGS